jgi:hypothetical protein
MRRLWGGGRAVRYIFVHPTCGRADVEAGFLPEWGRPKFLCRRCGVAFDEATVRLEWQSERVAGEPPREAPGQGRSDEPRG